MGIIGVALWVAFWALWCAALIKARLKYRSLGHKFHAGLVEVCLVGAIAILVNAYFDPTLESPQAAIWLWTLVGAGLGLVAISRRAVALDRRSTGSAVVRV